MSEATTLEAPTQAPADTSADVEVTPSAEAQVEAPPQEEQAPVAVEESAEPSQERQTPPRDFDEIDAAIKVAGSKNKAIASGAITDAEADSYDVELDTRSRSNNDRVAKIALETQQWANAANDRLGNYLEVEARIRDEALSDEVAEQLRGPALKAFADAAAGYGTVTARQALINSIAAIKGGDQLAEKARLYGGSLESLAAQLVPALSERVKAEHLEELRDGKLKGYRLISDKDFAEMEKAARNEAKSELGVREGTVSGQSDSSIGYSNAYDNDAAFNEGAIDAATWKRNADRLRQREQ